MEENTKMDKRQANELIKIVAELDGNARYYELLAETGNSEGHHKDWYKGKEEAYRRSSLLLKRFLRWHSYIDESK